MTTVDACWCPGRPAAYIQPLPRAVELEPLAESLHAGRIPVVWLDSARAHPVTGRWSVLAWDPWLTLTAEGDRTRRRTSRGDDALLGDPLERFRDELRRYPGPRHEALPPVGLGWMALLSYELGRWIERLPAPKADADAPVPDLLAAAMRQSVIVDHVRGRSWVVSIVDPEEPESQAAARAARRLRETLAWMASLDADRPASEARGSAEVQPTLPPESFEAMVRRAQEFIAAGDIFQANLSHRFAGPWTGSAWDLYASLRAVNPSPFAAFVEFPELAVVSCSPERLVQVEGGVASARPIAGTRPRGHGPDGDLLNSLELILSDKERAEHIMLVDLARNDLGRVCRPGTIAVDELMTIEDYSHVIHLVSNVRGALQPGRDAVDVIRAVFPGGTITGCPKVRSMEVIHDLEPVPRGYYTGSCGWIGFDGAMDLNILIRTLVLREGRVSFHAGAGIVADSEPAREYAETLAKAGALLAALHGDAAATPAPASTVTVP